MNADRNRRGRALIFTLGAVALSGAAWGQITDSPHDLSGLDPDRRLCIFCHTPHNADTSVTDAPLWNHAVTTQTYTLYNSPTLDATVGQPTGASRLCLSCHDGTVAVDSYGGMPGTIFLAGPDAIGADGLANDHPVSFQYTDALAAQDGELSSPSVAPSLIGSTIEQDLLFNDSLECASCHDVHRGPAAAAVDDSLLVVTQQGSTLCLVCHTK
jgi:predicted CXXCH cytochrome family protein